MRCARPAFVALMLSATLLSAMLLSTSSVGARAATTPTVPDATVTGPITGGLHDGPWFGSIVDPADYGYTEQEYFISGTARAFGADKPPASYTTRILVYRPVDANQFSGTVITEWNNVSLQADTPIEFTWLYPHIFAQGDAYVQVTAQQAGVCGQMLTGKPVLAFVPVSICLPLAVKGSDPVRYAPLHHPGDDYAYDIYSQAAKAVTAPASVSPLGDLQVEHIIALGQSQSGIALDAYLSNGADDAAQVFDGFLIDSDVGATAPESYRVPTLHLWGEESAQPLKSEPSPHHAVWSVAGMAHSDHWMMQLMIPHLAQNALGARPQLSRDAAEVTHLLAGGYGEDVAPLSATCAGGTQFPRRVPVNAAVEAIKTWVADNVAAPHAPALKFNLVEDARAAVSAQLPEFPVIPGLMLNQLTADAVSAMATSPLRLARDSHGNAIGGVRLPFIEHPIASYNGNLCVLLGTSTPLSTSTLRTLYPTHDDYVAKIVASTRESVAARFLTREDGIDIMRRACGSAIPASGVTLPVDQPDVCSDLEKIFDTLAR